LENAQHVGITDSQFAAIIRHLADERNSETSDMLFELHSRRKDGSEYWTDLSISPMRNTNRELTHLIVVMRDITARKQIEEEHARREQQLTFAIKAANMGLFDWDIPSNTTIFSREWKSQLGYTEEEIEDRHGEWESRLHPEDRPVAIARLENYLAGKIPTYDAVFRMRHKDGSWRWVNARGEVLYDEEGKRTRMIGCHIDLTAQKLAAESLELMKFCVDHTAESVVWISREGRILYANHACCSLRGYSAEELLSMSIWDLDVVPDYQADHWERHFDDLKQRGNIVLETAHRAKDGRVFPIEVSANYVKIGDRELNFAFSRDISERKRVEEERRELLGQLLHTQKLEGLGVMASGIAHDFNNLLTAMLGNASLARMELPIASPLECYLEEIESAARSAAKLTSQMLAYSGKGQFVIKPLRLDTLVNESVSLLKTVVAKNVELILNLEPASFEGDAAQTQQFIMNLISNASDAFKGEAGEIHVRTGIRHLDKASLYSPYVPDELPAGEYAFIEVEDYGGGIAKESLDKIFDPFFSTKMMGHGLGLAAVLGIVRSHQGTIKVASEPGQGTTVKVLLPASKTIVSRDRHETIEPIAKGKKNMILIVDDEEFVRSFLARCVEGAGFNVLTASDGYEGIEVYRQHASQISVVLLDLTMPRMSGLEVLKELRSHSVDLPILMISGYSEQDVSQQASKFGTCAFIQKPFSPNELIAAINALHTSKS
jgi:PAS domain S-box-containing protein